MCLHFIIYICCNPVFHLALCHLVYAVRERRMKRQLWMLMNKTWLLIPVCWADTEIEPLSAACQKFSWEVLHGSYKVEEKDSLFRWYCLDFSYSSCYLSVFLNSLSCSASFLSLFFTFPLHLSSLSCSKLQSFCIASRFSSLTSQSLSTTGGLTVGFFSLIHYILPCSSVPCQIKQKIFHPPAVKPDISLVKVGVRVVANTARVPMSLCMFVRICVFACVCF